MVQLPQTSRLRFRRIRPDDAERFDELDRDEGVMRFIDWQPQTLEGQREAVAEYIAEYDRWPHHGRFVAESPKARSPSSTTPSPSWMPARYGPRPCS